MIRTKPGAEATIRANVGATGLDLAEVGVVVLDADGEVRSSNERARELLRAKSPGAMRERLSGADPGDQAVLDIPGGGQIAMRSHQVSDGRVLLLQDAAVVSTAAAILRQASRQRVFAFLARDWAHDWKGMLHVIRINTALLAKLLQREPRADAATIARCLDAMPREVERLDRSIELIFNGRESDQPSVFDMGAVCKRTAQLVASRAARQRVEVAVELDGAVKDVFGFADQVQSALLNVVVNALAAMPEQGRLVLGASGDAKGVRVRVCDSGPGLQTRPDAHRWRPHFVAGRQRTGIGLHVTHAIVESHGGRIDCASNVPHGTCFEITLPAAATTERIGHGSRTDR